MTDPRNLVRRVTFHQSGYPLSDTEAHGTALASTTAYSRPTTDGQLAAVTDSAGCRTDYGYDARGNLTSRTRLAEEKIVEQTVFLQTHIRQAMKSMAFQENDLENSAAGKRLLSDSERASLGFGYVGCRPGRTWPGGVVPGGEQVAFERYPANLFLLDLHQQLELSQPVE